MKDMYKVARAILSNDEDAADAIRTRSWPAGERYIPLKQEEFFKTWLTRILINNNCNLILRKTKACAG